MARLWISMAADGEASEVERAALDEHLEHCDDCTEWRALAEAVVLHVRTTPPSPVPEGLLPVLPPRRSRRRGLAVRAGGLVAAASAAAVLGVAAAGWNSSPPAPDAVGRRAAVRDRRRLEHERHARRPAAAGRARAAVAPDALTL